MKGHRAGAASGRTELVFSLKLSFHRVPRALPWARDGSRTPRERGHPGRCPGLRKLSPSG
ncbi:hypothetical protein FTUN_3141 [Frigoriglobus tundricola]|uniref:Uncharacterized protein n=1 Tax=Frigoriglobus tundricola TaxID=2774151 RepID=A0A6M5YQR8_9BACT|nr:hypothetical protein FTUN_3141 [Frigoriglobus tundricola]